MNISLRCFACLAAVVSAFALSAAEKAPQATFPFYVYKDGGSKENHYFASGFTGDYGAIKMDEKCKDSPQSGATCLKFTYTGETPQNLKWAGVFFQNPPNNWGTSDGGFDITGAKKLTFWARGEKGGEVLEFKIGGVNANFSDSTSVTTGQVTLTRDWKQFEIPLDKEDLSYLLTGFAWVIEQKNSPDGAVFFLDEIAYVNQ